MDLLAQADSIPSLPSSWHGTATSISAVTFVVWFAYYMVSKMLPQMTADHRASMERVVSEYRTSMDKMISDHRAEMADTHKHHRAELIDARKDFREEITAERAHCVKELERIDHIRRGLQQVVLGERELAESKGAEKV